MLPSLLQQEAYMAKIDLKDTYLTFPVAKDSQPFLAFQGQEGVLFHFQVLPFRLCTAPYTFTKLSKPLVQFLRKVRIQILIYLDDMPLSEQQLLEHLSTVIWLLTSLGFITNVLKSVLTPSKQIDFLGFTINTSTMTISLPACQERTTGALWSTEEACFHINLLELKAA